MKVNDTVKVKKSYERNNWYLNKIGTVVKVTNNQSGNCVEFGDGHQSWWRDEELEVVE